MSSVSSAVSRALLNNVTEIFGVMGNGNAHFLDAAVRDGLNFTAVRHEGASVAAADAYFRITGKLAVATTTYGAGFSNAITGLAESVMAQIPTLLVVGEAPSTGLRPWDIDQTAINNAVGATTFVVDAERPAAITGEAMAYALRERTAVVLAIPYDIAAAEAPQEPTVVLAELQTSIQHPAPSPELLKQYANALSGAKRPVILYGRGARLSEAAEAITALADKIGALSASTVLAPNLLGSRTGDLGIAGGFSSEATAELIAEADVVLVVGARLNQFTMRFGDLIASGAQVLQIDIAETATHARVDAFLRGDATGAVIALEAMVSERPEAQKWSIASAERLGLIKERDNGTGQAPDGLLDPRSVASTLNTILPKDRIVVQDGGHFIGWGPMYWDVAGPHALSLVGTAYQTIGLGLASAVGAGAAAGDSTVVLATGDGGLLMGLADMESVIRSVKSGVIVVYNDAAYGAEVHQYGSIGLHEGPMLIPEVDFAAVAAGLGARSTKVRTLDDFAELREWVAAGARGVFVVDCRISPEVRAPYMEEVLEANRKASLAR